MGNTDEILVRFKSAYGIKSDKEVASLFGISQPDFARRKQRGTLLQLMIKEAIAQKVNLNWLLTGEGGMSIAGEHCVAHFSPVGLPPEIIDLLERAKLVLMSKNPIASDALQRNINYFAYAIEKEEELSEMKDSLAAMKAEIASLREALTKCIPRDDPGESAAEEGRPESKGEKVA